MLLCYFFFVVFPLLPPALPPPPPATAATDFAAASCSTSSAAASRACVTRLTWNMKCFHWFPCSPVMCFAAAFSAMELAGVAPGAVPPPAAAAVPFDEAAPVPSSRTHILPLEPTSRAAVWKLAGPTRSQAAFMKLLPEMVACEQRPAEGGQRTPCDQRSRSFGRRAKTAAAAAASGAQQRTT